MSSNPERVAKISSEILRREKYFNYGSLLLFVACVGVLTWATLYILTK